MTQNKKIGMIGIALLIIGGLIGVGLWFLNQNRQNPIIIESPNQTNSSDQPSDQPDKLPPPPTPKNPTKSPF